jgi:hypothetical protein
MLKAFMHLFAKKEKPINDFTPEEDCEFCNGTGESEVRMHTGNIVKLEIVGCGCYQQDPHMRADCYGTPKK